MNVDKAVLMFAGFIVLLSLALGYTVNPYWYLLTDSAPRRSFSRGLARRTAAHFRSSCAHLLKLAARCNS